jgi:hypothetical protein
MPILSVASSRVSIVFVLSALLLGGCALVSRSPEVSAPGAPPPARIEPGHYFVAPERGPDVVAELRAAPPPPTPEIADGSDIDADQGKSNARGFVRIGTGCYRDNDSAARDWVAQQGARYGAEKIQVYVLPSDEKAAAKLAAEMTAACTQDDGEPVPAALVATYYVRFKLPFGAQFRSLTALEKRDLGVVGGVQIGRVMDGTPAATANLREGDFVLKFNGTPVRDLADFRQLLRANMGKRVTLTISRGGSQVDRMVRLGVLATDANTKK